MNGYGKNDTQNAMRFMEDNELAYVDGQFYRRTDGAWQPVERKTLRHELAMAMGTTTGTQSALAMLRNLTYRPTLDDLS